MAVKKTIKKSMKKTTAKKKPAAKQARTRKTAANKKIGPKRMPTAKKNTAKSEAAPASKPVGKREEAKRPKGKFSAMQVNLGHIFLLRPKVSTSFRHGDFRAARHLLGDEAYASIEEAARAVAEKALEMTHEAPSKRGFRSGP